jgi:hypothetical protein
MPSALSLHLFQRLAAIDANMANDVTAFVTDQCAQIGIRANNGPPMAVVRQSPAARSRCRAAQPPSNVDLDAHALTALTRRPRFFEFAVFYPAGTFYKSYR